MRGKRTDLDIQAEIIERLMNWELWADIARDVWIHESTVSRIKDWMMQEVSSKSDKVAALIDTNNNLQSLADKRLNELLANWEEQIRVSELIQVRDSAFKQNQLLTGWATERIVFDKNVVDELDKLLG